jgi:hypothetical protein
LERSGCCLGTDAEWAPPGSHAWLTWIKAPADAAQHNCSSQDELRRKGHRMHPLPHVYAVVADNARSGAGELTSERFSALLEQAVGA